MQNSSTKSKLILGIDIGGTKLAVGLVDSTGGGICYKETPTKAEEGPQLVIDRLVQLCKDLIAESDFSLTDLAGIGVGCAGPLDWQAGVVKESPNLPGWVDVPLAKQLRSALADRPTFIENDANCAAVGEHRFGAGQGVRNMVYLTISTGIGGGAIVDCHLFHGENGFAAELGHITVVFNGRQCGCGNRGCLEAHASGTAIAAQARELASNGGANELVRLAGGIELITAQTVESAVRMGDKSAVSLWQESMEILGAGIASVINSFNPKRIVLGGGLTRSGDLLFEPVREQALKRAMPSLAKVVEIVPAELGSRVGVIGAAAAAMDRLDIK